ncbi:MAG TPA: tRNA epoxyqueuosine(34) reductase QueG [Candidatus Rubrimentiphilum sp.]|nr:tRNA epoxyqueuosine(34) reductase QueG [Candidatus Rubrimentiphilum sp.]
MQRCDPAAIKKLAREKALELGASDVRVASAHDGGAVRASLRESFARGDLATWPYDDEYARKAADPSHVLPDARSVICIAVSYGGDTPEVHPLEGRVSNYAWSADYHQRVKSLLREVAAQIDAAAGAPVTAIACDTKPIAERAFAARAGLGWIGKHTNLISPRFGSFVFLGEIVTKLELPPDSPLKKTCGSCTRCIPACPTGALRGDYTIDATRCIADLTQRTDAIPRDMRPLIGTWVWGCDLCQLACPPNVILSLSKDPEHGAVSAADEGTHIAQPSKETSTPELVRLLHLRSSEFKRHYARSAMGWRGGAILRRNAAVALGNALDRAAVPALARSLEEDPHALVRAHAAWALGRIGSPAAIQALQLRHDSEADPSVREEIESALEPFAIAGR